MTGRICILDPAHHIPGLHTCLAGADYYAYEPNEFFTYTTTRHLNKVQFKELYGFEYLADWSSINSQNYDCLIFTCPLIDYIPSTHQPSGHTPPRMLEFINTQVITPNSFKRIIVFETHDYDYDPTQYSLGFKIDLYFKRNYNKHKIYASNVKPFPYMMFVTPCVLETLCQPHSPDYNYQVKNNAAVWIGGVYNHRDDRFHVYRDRQSIHNAVKDHIVSIASASPSDYARIMKSYRINVDFLGVGEPNKRTLEILTFGSLLFTNITDLDWAFDPGDGFAPETIYLSPDDFKNKLKRLLEDEELYRRCLDNQRYLVEKYMGRGWLSRYLWQYIIPPVPSDRAVTIFLTACGRPQLLAATLKSFIKFNTYPIKECIIMEDSGKFGIDDFVHDLTPFPCKVIYNERRLGQMKSIGRGLRLLKTPYIFHCEEDWEFYDYGFIEKSMEILQKDETITSVWLRSAAELTERYGFIFTPQANGAYYYTGHPEGKGNFSWNPGLKTLKVALMFSPYIEGEDEGTLDRKFHELGMHGALTANTNGYVRHIGWSDHVW